MIYAILDGIENQMALPLPVDEDVLPSSGEKMKEEPARLPDSLEKARIEAKNSPLVKRFIPTSVTRIYCENETTPVKAR